MGDKKAHEKTSQALREKKSNLPQERSSQNNGVDHITGSNQDSDASTMDVSATTREEESPNVEDQKFDDTSISADDFFDSLAPRSSIVDNQASARMHSRLDVNNPLPHAETDQSGRETEARGSSVDDQESGRMNSLVDPNNPLPHAKIQFVDPFDPVTEANMLNMLREKRETSHENENLETKRECKLSRCPEESSTMDMSSLGNQGGHSGSLSKGMLNMSLLAGSKAPSSACDADRDYTFLTFSYEYVEGADSRQSTFDENIFDNTPLDFASAPL